MSEMVERVRKAIEAHCYEVGFQLKPAAGNRLARAAIEAMREPVWDGDTLDAMVRAFDRAKEKHGTRETLMAVCNAWITAALGEGE